MWTLLKNLLIGLASICMYKFGPRTVEHHFLPTIEGIAGRFHAISPVPPPATTFSHVQPPMAADSAFTVCRTDMPQEPFATMSLPEYATITGIDQGQWPFSADQDEVHSASSNFFEWFTCTTGESGHFVLQKFRQVLDNFVVKFTIFAIWTVTLKLLYRRNRKHVRSIATLRDQEKFRCQQEKVQDLELQSLNETIESQKAQINSTQGLLAESRDEVQRAKEATIEVEKHCETKVAELQDVIAKRDTSLAETTERAKTAEKAKTSLESQARKSQSNLTSALQKKDDEINTCKGTIEDVTTQKETFQTELKDARAQISKDKKKISDLEKQVSHLTEQNAELGTQVSQKDETIKSLREKNQNSNTERDKARKDGRDAKSKHEKQIKDLQAQITQADTQRDAAEERVTQLETLVTNAENAYFAAEERAAEATEKLESKEKELETQRADSNTSIAYLQRQLDLATAQTEELESKQKELETQRAESNTSITYHQRQFDIATAQETEDEEPQQPPKAAGQYNRKKKLRSNKRADGTIYTTKHPRYVPAEGRNVSEEGDTNLQENTEEQPTPEVFADTADTAQQEVLDQEPLLATTLQVIDNDATASKPSQERRICPYFQQGGCKFGIKCHNIHVRLPGM